MSGTEPRQLIEAALQYVTGERHMTFETESAEILRVLGDAGYSIVRTESLVADAGARPLRRQPGPDAITRLLGTSHKDKWVDRPGEVMDPVDVDDSPPQAASDDVVGGQPMSGDRLRQLAAPEFSEPVIHDKGDRVELEWTKRGYRAVTLVSDPLIEEWTAAENERRALRTENEHLREQLDDMEAQRNHWHLRYKAALDHYRDTSVFRARTELLAPLEDEGGPAPEEET